MLLKDYSVCFIINTNAHICVVRLIYIFSCKWDTYKFQALSLSALGSSKLTAMRSLSSLTHGDTRSGYEISCTCFCFLDKMMIL